MARLLGKMCLESEAIDGGENIKVEIPPIRAGILWGQKLFYLS